MRRHAPALLVLAGLAAAALLVALDEGAYLRLRSVLGLKPFAPFLDLHAVMSAVACWHDGVDVYAANPCDALGRLHIYSPLLLRLPAVFGEPALLRPLGLALALGFFACVAWLPKVERGWPELAMLLAVASPVTAFALERANLDLLLFAMVVPGAMLLRGGQAARIGGYALFLLAGLLKFYPLVLLGLLVRERPRVAFALVLVAAAILRATVAATDGEFQRAIANIHVQAVFWGSFAAHNLPRGLMQVGGAGPGLGIALATTLAAGAGVLVVAVLRAPGLDARLAALPDRTRLSLLVAATLVAGCFLAGENIEYRAIFLLPALPGLLALSAIRPIAAAAWLVPALLWDPLTRRIVARLAPRRTGRYPPPA